MSTEGQSGGSGPHPPTKRSWVTKPLETLWEVLIHHLPKKWQVIVTAVGAIVVLPLVVFGVLDAAWRHVSVALDYLERLIHPAGISRIAHATYAKAHLGDFVYVGIDRLPARYDLTGSSFKVAYNQKEGRIGFLMLRDGAWEEYGLFSVSRKAYVAIAYDNQSSMLALATNKLDLALVDFRSERAEDYKNKAKCPPARASTEQDEPTTFDIAWTSAKGLWINHTGCSRVEWSNRAYDLCAKGSCSNSFLVDIRPGLSIEGITLGAR